MKRVCALLIALVGVFAGTLVFGAEKYTTVTIREEIKVQVLTGRDLPPYVNAALQTLPPLAEITSDNVAVVTDLMAFFDAFKQVYPEAVRNGVPNGFACFYDWSNRNLPAPRAAAMCRFAEREKMIFILLDRKMKIMEGNPLTQVLALEKRWNQDEFHAALKPLVSGLIQLGVDDASLREQLLQQWPPAPGLLELNQLRDSLERIRAGID